MSEIILYNYVSFL